MSARFNIPGKWVVPDFESTSQCDLKKAGAWRYWEDPSTNPLCLAFEFSEELGGGVEIWYPGDSIPPRARAAMADPDTKFIAHNADFEKAGWRNYMVPVLGWPDVPNRRWHDTAARCAQLTLARGLEKALKQLDGPVEKDMEGNRLTLGLSRPDRKGKMPEITPAVLERVGEYCLGDVHGQAWLHNRVGYLDQGERITYLMDQEINERGVRLDVPLIRAMRKVVDRGSAPLAAEFKELTGGLKFTQRDKIMSWLLDRGVVLPDMKKETLDGLFGETDEGEEVDEEDRLEIELPPDVERALRIRRLIGSASIKKLNAMENCVCSDGRARGLLLYHGAGTGRWSGKLLQPQNFPRGSLLEDGEHPDIDLLVQALMSGDPEWVEALYGPPVEAVVSSLRHVLIASPGHALVAGDYSGIEARVVLALAGQHDKCALLASGADVYIDMAQDIYGMEKKPVTDREYVKWFKGAHLERRTIGKNTILGCGFGMGKNKFHSRYCPHQPLEFAGQVITAYREDWAPLVPKLWRGLEYAATQTVWTGKPHSYAGIEYRIQDRWLVAHLPSGREIFYFDPKPVRRPMPWDKDDIRPGFTYRAWKLGRLVTIDAYGGLLTENAVQALARDILRDALKRFRKEGLKAVLTVHDEGVLDMPEARADHKLIEQIMAAVEPWTTALKVPVAVEGWAGYRYRK